MLIGWPTTFELFGNFPLYIGFWGSARAKKKAIFRMRKIVQRIANPLIKKTNLSSSHHHGGSIKLLNFINKLNNNSKFCINNCKYKQVWRFNDPGK